MDGSMGACLWMGSLTVLLRGEARSSLYFGLFISLPFHFAWDFSIFLKSPALYGSQAGLMGWPGGLEQQLTG